MRILIAGDMIPTDINQDMFEGGDVEGLVGSEIYEMLNSSDLTVINLEGCLYDGKERIKKSGSVVKASAKSVSAIEKMKIDAISLANNHCLDCGEEGLNSTINVLKKAGIEVFGAGRNISEAKKEYFIARGGLRIGFYSCAEYEFTIATEKSAGANPFDSLTVLDDIVELKNKVDYLVVLYHGGKEMYQYPAPYVQKRCRKLAEKGADLVLCQHSHCIGCYEEYMGATILYGQGDFLFCRQNCNEMRNSGLIVSVELPQREVSFVPIVRKGNGISIAKEAESRKILDSFSERSRMIEEPGFVISNYEEFAEKSLVNYDAWSLGIIGKILKKLKLKKLQCLLIGKSGDINQLNALQCEAHRDLYISGLKRRIEKG